MGVRCSSVRSKFGPFVRTKIFSRFEREKIFYPFQFFTVKKILSETEFSFINFIFIKSATTKKLTKAKAYSS
jgi:hypothetical protein